MPEPTGAQGAGQPYNGTPPAAAAAAGAGTSAGTAAGAAPAAGASGEPDTQKAIDAIIARERTRAATELASVRSDFERQITELRSQIPTPAGQGGASQQRPEAPDVNAAIEAARKPLQDELASERAARLQLEETTLTSIVQSAAKDTVSPETVALMAKGQVRFNKGTTEVVDANGQLRYTASGPMTVKDLVAEIVGKNDFLVPASVRKGGNYQGAGNQSQTPIAEQIAQLESEGKYVEANRLKSQQLVAMRK